jgi:hypothetical protein
MRSNPMCAEGRFPEWYFGNYEGSMKAGGGDSKDTSWCDT